MTLDEAFQTQTAYPSYAAPEERIRVALTALCDLHERLKADPVNRTAILYQIQMNGIRAKVLVTEIICEQIATGFK